MKVYENNFAGITPAETGRTQETQKPDWSQTDRTGAGNRSEDHVELSSTLGHLSRAMASYGSSRASHVQALAAEYQSGSYSPDSLATSRGIISEALSAGLK